MKKVIAILMALIMMFCLAGCTKCTSIETKQTTVTIEDVNYRAMWMQPIYTGKTLTYITHPAQYQTIVNYNGTELKVDNSNYYNWAKEHIGEEVNAEIEIRQYDDNTIRYSILQITIP